ncbi:hypothetical protein F0261_17905 [Alteromonas sp. 07-89-2]|uniref:P-loop NTPase fold protein n=1 Tax=Alteromonas sp. 07-89-2 TaxID=2607609 RepID=UPI00148D3805|nr:P-loop NTPase fold protein [Alteromonas sp. 07-89-2]NOH59903.1 hypothetical protein [Alteromonas sp. 07-89-2]
MVDVNASMDLRELKIKERLEALCKKDPLWPGVLAAREALRVLPIIGIAGHFNFWIESRPNQTAAEKKVDKHIVPSEEGGDSTGWRDNRVRFVLASFSASGEVLHQAKLPVEERQLETFDIIASTALEAAEVAFSDAYSTIGINKTEAVAFAAEAASFASATAKYGASRAVEAAESAIAACNNASKVLDTNGATHAFFQDLKAAEDALSTHSVIDEPLWSNTRQGVVEMSHIGKFQSAVETLFSESSGISAEGAEALEQMLKLYNGYVSGIANINKNNGSTKASYEALSKVSSEDINANKDTLNRGALVNGLANILCDKEHIHPLTIGLMGNWGSGKSQVLALLKKELKARDCEQPFLFGEFNAWAYEHAKSSQAAMAHEVISALTSHDKFQTVNMESDPGSRLKQSILNLFRQIGWIMSGRVRIIYAFAIRKHLNKVLQSIGWLSLFVIASAWLAGQGLNQNQIPDFSKPLTSGALIAIIASLWQLPKQLRYIISQPMTKEFLTYIKLPNYASHIGEIAEMQKDIRLIAKIRLGFQDDACHDYLGKLSNFRRLLFVVDDLDRCSPEGIVKTFEAIRLVLHIPHVTVVVAVDQRIALAALALHYKGVEPYHTLQDARAIARDYLAKVIQLPVVISDGDNESLTEFLSDIWLEEGTNKQNWLAHLIKDDELQAPAEHLEIKTRSSRLDGLDLDSFIEDDGLSEYELAKLILETEPKSEPPKPEVLKGLSDHQKAALYYWATHFGLTNARQLKRLDNSYNLIRLVAQEEDKIALTQKVDSVDKQQLKFSYGYLVTLMTLEFINGIEVTALRENASRFLRKGTVCRLNAMANQQHKATLIGARIVIESAAEQLYSQTEAALRFEKLLRYVENFALPAIDGFDVDTETVSNSQPNSVKG